MNAATYVPPKWQDARLMAAYERLDDALAEVHPEMDEYATIERARDAVEDADLALERLSGIRRGEVK